MCLIVLFLSSSLRPFLTPQASLLEKAEGELQDAQNAFTKGCEMLRQPWWG